MVEKNSMSMGELVERLNGDCEYYTEEKIRKLLSKRSDLKGLAQNNAFSRSEVNKIFCALVGRKFNFYLEFQSRKSDLNTGGPVVRVDHSEKIGWIEEYYRKLEDEYEFKHGNIDALALICQGGFLSNKNDNTFYYAFVRGLNVLIGDRGTGKSTVLNLMSLLCDSTVERSGIFLKEALRHKKEAQYLESASLLIADASYDEQNRRKIDLREIRRTLRLYRINRYVSIFHWKERFVAFYMEPERGFDLFYFNRSWERLPENIEVCFPVFPIFRQGDVFRLSDSEDKYAFNQVLDGLNPTLANLRKKIANHYNGIMINKAQEAVSEIEIDETLINSFIAQEFSRIDRLKELKDVIVLSDEVRQFVNDIIYRSRRYGYDANTIGLIDVLKVPNEHVFFFCYGTILNLFSEKLYEINRLIAKFANNNKNIEFVVRKEIEIACRQTINIARTRIVVLQELVSLVRNLPDMGKFDKKIWKGIEGILGLRHDLVTIQASDCSRITKSLQEINIDVDIKNSDVVALEENLPEQVSLIAEAGNIYNTLVGSPIYAKISDIRPLASKLRQISNILRRFEFGTQEEFDRKERDMSYVPVNVRLRQGEEFRSFENLSFGQKAGIILMSVIRNTKSNRLLIDQPEDHLDVDTIINILAPALNKISENMSILIATHSENLVFGFNNDHIAVMQEEGSNGYISAYGDMNNYKTTKDVLIKLVGGKRAFCNKINIYNRVNETVRCENDRD